MRDAIANVLGSIPGASSTLRSLADAGVLVDALIIPRARWRPWRSAADVVAALGLATALPLELWDVASTDAGGVVTGLVGGVHLTPAPVLDALLERRGVGLYNGRDFRSHRVLELAAPGATFAASSTSALDPASNGFAALVAFRVGLPAAVAGTLIGKFDAEGWLVRLEADGTLSLIVDAGAGPSFVSLAGNHADGAWHFLVAWRTGTTLGLYSDLTAVTTATVGGLGSLASSGPMQLGAVEAQASAPVQLAAAAYFPKEAVAELGSNGGRNACRAWWAAQVTGAPLSVSTVRSPGGSSSSVVDVDDEGGEVYHVCGRFAPAWLYMNGPAGPHGLQITPAFESLIGSSDVGNTDDAEVVGGGWARKGSPSVTENAGDCPRGFRAALDLGKTSGHPDGRLSARVPMVNGTTYHFAIRVRWDGAGPGTVGVDAGPVWRIRDVTDATTLQVRGTSTVGRWHWHFVDYTAAATADHLVQYLASVDTEDSAGKVLVQYASGGEGAQPLPLPELTRAGGSTTDATYCSIEYAAGSALASRADRGTMIVDAVALPGMPLALGAAQRILASVSDSSLDNARQFGASSGTIGPKLRLEVFAAGVHELDQSSVDLVPSAWWLLPRRWAFLWDRAGIPDKSGATFAIEIDGQPGPSGVDAFTAAPDGDIVQIGLSVSATGWWVGGIQRVRILSVATSGSSAP